MSSFELRHSFVIRHSGFVIIPPCSAFFPTCTNPLHPGRGLLFFAPFFTPRPFRIMSQHSSLKTSGSVGTKRSVLKRGERVKLLKSRGQWKEGRLPTNLPKTKPE